MTHRTWNYFGHSGLGQGLGDSVRFVIAVAAFKVPPSTLLNSEMVPPNTFPSWQRKMRKLSRERGLKAKES